MKRYIAQKNDYLPAVVTNIFTSQMVKMYLRAQCLTREREPKRDSLNATWQLQVAWGTQKGRVFMGRRVWIIGYRLEESLWKEWHLSRILKGKKNLVTDRKRFQGHSDQQNIYISQVQRWKGERWGGIQVTKDFFCYDFSYHENPLKDIKQGRDVIKYIFQKGSFSGSVEDRTERKWWR